MPAAGELVLLPLLPAAMNKCVAACWRALRARAGQATARRVTARRYRQQIAVIRVVVLDGGPSLSR